MMMILATRSGILRAILCKNQTKWEMKNFDPQLKFACN